MGYKFLFLGFALYIGAAALCLKLPARFRLAAFTIVNWLALLLPMLGLHRSFAVAARAIFIYLAVVLVQYTVTQIFARRSQWGSWLAILTPVAGLFLLRGYPTPSLMLVGFSYMAFRLSQAAYEYAGDATLSLPLSGYLTFAFFSPAIPVGPINSYSKFSQSLPAAQAGSLGWRYPLERLAVGAAKYLLLGTLFSRLNFEALFSSGNDHSILDLAVASVAYYLYLYCNFSGFCDLAIGSAALLGIELEENFDSPLLARNIKDFWNRWHITLSTYVRHLIFTPLSVWLVRNLGSKYLQLSMVITLGVAFSFIGVWHGSGWNFLAFGLLHAAAMSVHHFYTLGLRRFLPLPMLRRYQASFTIKTMAMVTTFSFVSASFFMFANDATQICKIYSLVFGYRT